MGGRGAGPNVVSDEQPASESGRYKEVSTITDRTWHDKQWNGPLKSEVQL